MSHPLRLIVIGFILSIMGWILPFLMVIHILESSFALNFLAYTASVMGLFLGIIGAALYIQTHRK